jgi:putative membrane protein
LSRNRFSQADFDRIAAAVAKAEHGTSGEIVPVFAEASGAYADAAWRAGSVLGLAGVIAGEFLDAEALSASAMRPLLFFGACSATGFLLTLFWPALRRRMATRRSMDEQVSLRAEAAFMREQVFATRDRTGVLIFVSFLERRVRVIADSGIHAKAALGTWDGVVAKVVDGMKAGRPADGIVEAVTLCGDLLRQHGFTARPDDTNELPDALRVEK